MGQVFDKTGWGQAVQARMEPQAGWGFRILGCLAGLVVALGHSGCGYEPVFGGAAPAAQLTVATAPYATARVEVVQAAVAGARSELGRAGVLDAGTGYPRLVVEVTRVDELSTGIRPSDAEPGERLVPLARGSAVAVVGRAWVETSAGSGPERDTGDLRRVEFVESGPNAVADSLRFDQALASAARRLGRDLVRRVLGEPVPGNELL